MQPVCGVRCSILGCSSTYSSTDQHGGKVRFFNIPSRPHEIQRKYMWIANIRKARGDTEGVWLPSKYAKVCSRHFVDNIKAEDPRMENYVPTIFPFVKKETSQKYNVLLARQRAKEAQRKLTETSETPSLGVTKHPLPSSDAATAGVAGGAKMEGQVRAAWRGVHLASVVDGDGSLENGIHITLDDFLREWSADPHPRYVGPKSEDAGLGEPAVKSARKDSLQGDEGPTFECPICADSYVSSRSLRRHLSRRSFLARLPCRKCGSCHLAFNRCTLIMRAQGCRIAASNATVSALPPGETLVPVELSEEVEGGASQTDVPMTVLEKVLQSVVCSECYVDLDDEASREDHFHPSRGNLIRCTNCPMLCTSECALRAHRRLHSQRRPFVCPECGLRCEDEWAVFHQHVTKHCHHFERIVGYHCQLCPALLLDKAELAGHIVDTHSNPLHKCQICPMAFVSLESFQTHRQTAHPKHLRTQWWVILKCPLCEAVFASAELLANHATAHLDQCGRSLFKCASCDSLQPTRADLVAHVCKLHPDKHQATTWGKEEEPLLHCLGAKQTVSEVINLDDDETPEPGSNTKTVNNSAAKLKKEDTEKPAKPLATPCSPAEKGKQGATDQTTDQPSAVNSRKASSDKPEEKLANSSHVCAKCGFQSSDSSVFRDHIKQHRPPNQETFQCPECGLCYVVEPSLRKHLRGVHRVEETEVKDGAVAPGPNGAAVSGLRCSVCLATFDTERELKSHTRSHGMAFLKKVKAKDGTV